MISQMDFKFLQDNKRKNLVISKILYVVGVLALCAFCLHLVFSDVKAEMDSTINIIIGGIDISMNLYLLMLGSLVLVLDLILRKKTSEPLVLIVVIFFILLKYNDFVVDKRVEVKYLLSFIGLTILLAIHFYLEGKFTKNNYLNYYQEELSPIKKISTKYYSYLYSVKNKIWFVISYWTIIIATGYYVYEYTKDDTLLVFMGLYILFNNFMEIEMYLYSLLKYIDFSLTHNIYKFSFKDRAKQYVEKYKKDGVLFKIDCYANDNKLTIYENFLKYHNIILNRTSLYFELNNIFFYTENNVLYVYSRTRAIGWEESIRGEYFENGRDFYDELINIDETKAISAKDKKTKMTDVLNAILRERDLLKKLEVCNESKNIVRGKKKI